MFEHYRICQNFVAVDLSPARFEIQTFFLIIDQLETIPFTPFLPNQIELLLTHVKVHTDL